MRHWRHRHLIWDYDTKAWEWQVKVNPHEDTCAVRGCAGKVANAPSDHKARSVCNKCKRRRWRYNNPLQYLYSELRKSARRRGIYFHIHQGEFIEFCMDNQIYERSPKFSKTTLTFERVKPELGYTMYNIEIITQSENAKRNYRYQRRDLSTTTPEIDCPF